MIILVVTVLACDVKNVAVTVYSIELVDWVGI
jgi:hypothetical protein